MTLTALEIHFKCKGVDGVILCEDQFEYRDIEVKPGELFGMDDAVFITSKAITLSLIHILASACSWSMCSVRVRRQVS